MASVTGNYFNLSEDEETEAFLAAFNMIAGLALPMTFKSAIDLGLLDSISRAGPGAYLSPSELASRLPKRSPLTVSMIDRVLRFLSCHSLLNCTLRTSPDGHAERLYGLTPICKFFTDDGDGVSLAPVLAMSHDKTRALTWYNLADAVLEGGIAFNMTYGMSPFDYYGTNPGYNKIFNLAMSNHSTIIMNKILESYKGFEGLKSIVDVGGGTGTSLKMIVSKYPSIKGINFDLPHVIKDAPSQLGVEHMGGDMFVSVPKGDAIFMKWICHNWNDESCIKVLKNCYNSLPDDGKVIVVEVLLPEVPDDSPISKNAANLDIAMMTQTPRGKERTEEEFKALSTAAGFREFHKVCSAFHVWIMECCK